MLSKHLLKVIIGFCGMIIVGLVSLVIVDSLKDKEQNQVANPVILPAVTPTPVKEPIKKAPVKKSTVPINSTVR